VIKMTKGDISQNKSYLGFSLSLFVLLNILHLLISYIIITFGF
jgi:hypothetical protein